MTSVACVVALLTIGVPAATTATGVDSTPLRTAVTPANLQAHLEQFQAFGEASTADPEFGHPTRVDGSPGYELSVQYVADQLRSAGYSVTIQPFTFDRFVEETPPVFARTAPTAQTYVEGEDFLTMEYSGSGDVTAPLEAAGGIVIPPVGGSASGCSASDYSGFTAGSIALVQRGTCTFRQKADVAKAAGAVAVVIFNEGNEVEGDDRVGLLSGTLGPPQHDIPVIGTSFAVGEDLYSRLQAGEDVEVHVAVDATVVPTDSANVLADTPTGRDDRVVLVGAHLDSVDEGPGVNDNGSGTAAILEIAKQIAALRVNPTNTVRFAFWGGEEFGLLGAEHYASTLPKAELKNIALNLNFDMVGSPNYVRFVYDGDGNETGTKGPSGSGNIEQVFLDYFASQGLATEPTAFDGRSDYGPFIDRGIPAGGLFTGAEGIKTAEQAAIYGGTAGIAYDPCYHQLCDQWPSNVNMTVLDQMADAAADATLQFAMTKSSPGGTSKGSKTATTDFEGNKLRK
jgi:Zn-dependent M28 family amino/carboxypeptidase